MRYFPGKNSLKKAREPVLPPPETNPAAIPPAEKIIRSTIRRGAPRFNNGKPQARANLYELAAEVLLTLPALFVPT